MNRRLLMASSAHTVIPDPSGNPNGNADTAAIQGAIDSLADTGGIVVIDGEFWTNQPILIPDGVHLVGLGWKASVIHHAAGAVGHVIHVTGEAASWGIHDLLIDGHYEDCPAGLDNLRIDGGYIGGWGGKYGIVDRVASKWAARDAFSSEAVETKFSHCYGYGSRRNNFRASGSDQFYSMCTSGNSVGDGVQMENASGFRLVGFKSWCSGFDGARDSGTFAGTYVNPGAVGYRLAGANWQVVACESQDAASEGAAISTRGGLVDLYVDSPGRGYDGASVTIAAVDVGYTDGADIRVRVGDGSSHVGPKVAYCLRLGNTTNSRISVMGSLEKMLSFNLVPGSVNDASNHVTVGPKETVVPAGTTA